MKHKGQRAIEAYNSALTKSVSCSVVTIHTPRHTLCYIVKVPRLTPEEIHRRLVELRALHMLYGKARERIALLEAENRQLKERIKELEKRDSDKNIKIEALAFQLEQIQMRVFGKKSTALRVAVRRERKERDISSYRRPLP